MPHLRPARPAALILAVLLVAGCGHAAGVPSPSPADFSGINTQLQAVGISIANVVSGDAGCPDATLAPTAIAFDARGLDQTAPVRIRVYMFRNRAAWERLAGEVAACARTYVTDPSTYKSVARRRSSSPGRGRGRRSSPPHSKRRSPPRRETAADRDAAPATRTTRGERLRRLTA